MQSIVSFENVRLNLGGAPIYEDLTYQIAKGEFLCLLGPSGCGKSTALRLIGDLMPFDGGSVKIEGQSPAEAWQRLAFVFQQPRLLPWRNALENAAFGIEARFPKVSKKEREERARVQLHKVGLSKDIHKMPYMLSGGEKQRVSIARALALDPEVILMDEPFSALDPNTRVKLRDQLISLWEQTKKTIIFVTHDIDEALYLADRILVLTRKPARVTSEITINEARPRDVWGSKSLAESRLQLGALFNSLGNEAA